MFDRFIRLARAKKALQEQRFLDALQQASDPLIESDRRSERIRRKATEQLIQRVRTRLQSGDVSTAQTEARRLAQLASGEQVQEVLAVVEAAVARHDQAASAQRNSREEFRKLVDAGDLSGAENLLTVLQASDGDRAAMTDLLVARRKQAVLRLDVCVRDAAAGSVGSAIESYLQAGVMDCALPEKARAAALRTLAGAVIADVESDARVVKAAPDRLASLLANYSLHLGKLPALRQDRAIVGLEVSFVDAVERTFKKVESLDAAADLARAVRSSCLPVADKLDRVVAPLALLEDRPVADASHVCIADGGIASGSELVTGREQAGVLVQLQEAAQQGGFAHLAKLAKKRVASAVAAEEQLAVARSLLQEGQLEAARAMFVTFLDKNPMHAGVQKELEMVDEGMADLDRRLADLRLTLRAGRLREACTSAILLVGSSRIAAEAQQLLAEARSRMALVDKGLDEVRVSLHGRAAATLEGVRHCLKRLEELAKVQVDHEQLPAVMAAVVAEMEALEQCEKAQAALVRSDVEAVLKALPGLVSARGGLLAVERIDAKLCALGDGVVRHGDRALADGRLAANQRCIAVLQQLEPVRADFSSRAAEWQAEHNNREAKVGELLRDARSRLIDRDLADAERLVEEAQAQWRESAEVQAFAHQLHKLRKQTHTLEQVAAMAEDKDFLGAHQKLAAMPNVPPLLRTRVYDMKQDLARAQGLEASFLLRVDEGGEQLVMRGESVSVGNVRQARADLPVLANLAGRHATIRRSMSFHGGMQDTVVAEDGEVRVGDRKVQKHVLKSGDRLHLGPALGLLYQKPTSRSLTSRLLLQSGFQVAGTDRVLLMKDRGRDGRILLGPGRDVHVTVAKATGEVEIFASNTGQMRVFCEQGGSIDGTVFRGEHPVAAGQVVEAAGITFLLLPWQPMT